MLGLFKIPHFEIAASQSPIVVWGVRENLDCLLGALHAFFQVNIQVDQGPGESVERPVVRGIELNRLFQRLKRLLRLPLLQQRVAFEKQCLRFVVPLHVAVVIVKITRQPFN
ncbi:MAG: hypothetical protein JW836_15300 [Deltaproteobacteria bacterium]|nr:hypothetical protein [Deltaproteobacteria bacterium]